MASKRRARWLGYGLPYESIDGLPGRMIVSEGTDGVGRYLEFNRGAAAIRSAV